MRHLFYIGIFLLINPFYVEAQNALNVIDMSKNTNLTLTSHKPIVVAQNSLNKEEIERLRRANQSKLSEVEQKKNRLDSEFRALEREKERNSRLLEKKQKIEQSERQLRQRQLEIENQEKTIQETKKRIETMEEEHRRKLRQEKLDVENAKIRRLEKKKEFEKNLQEEAKNEQDQRRQDQLKRDEELESIKEQYKLGDYTARQKKNRASVLSNKKPVDEVWNLDSLNSVTEASETGRPLHYIYTQNGSIIKNYLTVYSNKNKTTVPPLTLPRFPFKYKIGFTYYSSSPRQVFTMSYWLNEAPNDVSVDLEGNYILVCLDSNLQAHYYHSDLTNRNHLCYTNKSEISLGDSNNYKDSFQVLSRYRVQQILLIDKQDQRIIGTRNPIGYKFMYYNIYTTEFGSKPLINIAPVR